MFKYVKRYWYFGLFSSLCMILEVSMDLIQPRFMETIVDEGVLGLGNGGSPVPSLILSVGISMIICVAIGCSGGVLCGVFENLCSQNVANEMRKDAFTKIFSLSFDQVDAYSTGTLITRVSNDVVQIQTMIRSMVRGLVRNIMLFGGGIYCMYLLDVPFGLVMTCAFPLVIILVVVFIAMMNPRAAALQKSLDELNNFLQEDIAGLRVIKASVREKTETERFDVSNADLVTSQLKVLLLQAYMSPLMNVIMNATCIIIIRLGGFRVQAGAISPGVVMASFTYITQILNGALQLAMNFQNVSRGMVSIRRVRELLEAESSVVFSSEAALLFEDPGSATAAVECRDVSFAYGSSPQKNVLSQISFAVSPGETLAIMGACGCGKSTLVDLICRFYDAGTGEVLLKGKNIRDYDLSALRKTVSIAFQTSEIFSKTVAENIRFGRPDATDAEVYDATAAAQAVEFVDSMPEGFDTLIAQQGRSLSGGQKQRLALSRALIADTPVLILDDATGALDLKTEAAFFAALQTYAPTTTKIIVASRIATAMYADRILLMEDGRVAAIGSHAELLKTSSVYQDIYHSQMGGGVFDGADE